MAKVPNGRFKKPQPVPAFILSLSKLKLHKYIIHNVFTDMSILIFNKDKVKVIT